MPTFNMTARKMRAINNGITVLLNEDIDLFFAMRLDTIQEALIPILKPVTTGLKKHDKKYRATDDDDNPIPMKRGGQVIGNMVDPAQAEAATEAEDKILDTMKKVICPDIPWKDLEHAQYEDHVPVPGWVLKAFRPMLNVEGVDLTKAGEAKKEKAKAKGKAKPPRGAAASRKAQAEEASEE